MKGRIYDPTLGRFLQADPFIQAPNNSQSYNRYAYVFNNPLSNIDPSGYISLNPFKKLTRNIIRGISKVFGAKFTNMVGNAMSFFCGPAAPACAGAWNYEFARAHGASSSGALRAGFTAAVTTYAFQQIGNQYSEIGDNNLFDVVDGVQDINNLHAFGGNLLTSGQIAGQIASHAMVGGVTSSLNGGKFGHGFFSAGVTKGLGTSLNTHYNNGPISGTLISMTVGGTASVLSGSKFANGARTAMFQSLFNEFGQGNLKKRLNAELAYWDKKTTNFFNSLFGINATISASGGPVIGAGISGATIQTQIITDGVQQCSATMICYRLGPQWGAAMSTSVSSSVSGDALTVGRNYYHGFFFDIPNAASGNFLFNSSGAEMEFLGKSWGYLGGAGYQRCEVTVSSCGG